MNTAILIPARLGSRRLPNKPTVKLGGVPMIRRVAEACEMTGYPVYVLTDDVKVAKLVKGFETIVDSSVYYNNGTERCASASFISELDQYEYFINVQGDMPDITTTMIDMLVHGLHNEDALVATLYTKMTEQEQNNRHNVKMVHNNYVAHWFARDITYGVRHLGVYGYRNETLKDYLNWETSLYEEIESLEQLRWIENEVPISVYETQFDGVEINTVADVHSWHLRNNLV
jgi:3-deoxy-manno-octulosonate cytidylyltransferase (CMP-KDO synthetase)